MKSCRDLPFVEQTPSELLGIVPGRVAVDEDFEGFGWGRVPRLRLESSEGAVELQDVIVIALHAADGDESAPGDLDLELRVGDEALIVALSTLLATWAPTLPGNGTWVLALCNPTGKAITRPASIPPAVPLWLALGDVDAWAEGDDRGALLGLTARSWICL